MNTTKHHRNLLSLAAAIMAGCASLHAAPVIYIGQAFCREGDSSDQ